MEQKLLELYEEGDWIVSGGCEKGADRFARKFAKQYGTALLEFYPNYKKYGRGAPIVRNEFVAVQSDIIVACVIHPDDGIDDVLLREIGGTENTLKQFVKRGNKFKEMITLV